MPRSARSFRSFRSTLLPQLVWAMLWLGLTLGTGTPQAALRCGPKIVNYGAALLFLLFAFTHVVGRTPKGRPILLFTGLMRACGTAPVALWLAATLWIGGFAWSVAQATMPRLALEKAGEFGWRLLLCALVFGYAAQGWRRLRRVLGGIMVAGDGVLLLFCVGQAALVFPNRVYGVLYAALLLPLAVWEAGRTRRSEHPAALTAYFWSRLRIALLLLFFALSLPPFSTWTGLGAAWPGVQSLAGQKPVSGWGPGAFDFVFPQFMGETTPRLPGLLFPGLWARIAVESGCLAMLGLLFCVVVIVAGGAAKSSAHRGLGRALRVSIALFLVFGLWLSPDGAPALQVTFLALLALMAALRWGPGLSVYSEKAWPHERKAPLLRHSSLSCAFALFFTLAGLGFACWRVPAALRQTRAHWLDDQSQAQSVAQSDPEAQLKLLRAAIAADPNQPAYWIHLAQARLQRDGLASARVGASYLRVALDRAVPHAQAPDAALWHQIAQLAYQAGDYDRALLMAQRAVHYDPFCSDYRLFLADCYLRDGARIKAETERQIALRCLNNAPAHPAHRYLRRLKTD